MPARRNDTTNTYQYGVRDGVVRDGVGIVLRSGVENVVRFELGDSRARDGMRDASSFDRGFVLVEESWIAGSKIAMSSAKS